MELLPFLSHIEISDVLFAKTYRAKKTDYPMRNKGRYACGLIYTVCGTETYHFRNQSISASPHSVLFIPKGEAYSITLEGEESVAAAIDFDLTASMLPRPFLTDCEGQKGTLQALFSQAEGVWKEPKAEGRVLSLSLLYRLFGILIQMRSLQTDTAEAIRLRPAISYLQAHCFDRDFRIVHLAEQLQISEKYFGLLFKSQYHLSPKDYLTALRMEQAKKLLLSEKISVGDVAKQLGYCDLYHFTKIFTKKAGLSPSAYRKQHQK